MRGRADSVLSRPGSDGADSDDEGSDAVLAGGGGGGYVMLGADGSVPDTLDDDDDDDDDDAMETGDGDAGDAGYARDAGEGEYEDEDMDEGPEDAERQMRELDEMLMRADVFAGLRRDMARAADAEMEARRLEMKRVRESEERFALFPAMARPGEDPEAPPEYAAAAAVAPTAAALPTETVSEIREAMRGFTLPDANIPSWAKAVPEDEWKGPLVNACRGVPPTEKK